MTTTDDTQATRASLIERLRHRSDQASWQEFFNRYGTLIYAVALKAGLTDAEAQDVVQETVISVSRRIEGFVYDPKVCSFRTWMLRLTHWRIINQWRRRTRENLIPLPDRGEPWPTFPGAPEVGDSFEQIWEEEWRRTLYQAALEAVKKKVSPAQFQLFDLHVHERWTPQQVARRMRRSAASVYLAKHRVSRLIQKEVERLERSGL